MFPHSDRASGPSRRVPLLGAFLVVTLVLTAWLGYEALAAAGSHRQTAESVLDDYTEIALSRFAGIIDDRLDDFLDTAFDEIDGSFRDFGPLPDPREIVREMDDAARDVGCRSCDGVESPLIAFTADLATRAVRSRGREESVALALADSVARLRADVVQTDDEGIWVAPEGLLRPDPVIVGYLVAQDSVAGTRVMGFALPTPAVAELIAEWFDDTRLLPDPIGGGLPNDSILHATVRIPGGPVLWSSSTSPAPAPLRTRGLGAEAGALTVEASVRPDRAQRVIIGGLPRSRLPLLIVLLALTLGVGVAALVQFRREVRFQELRDDFVSGVSHELRTPLAQIRMFAELQETDRLPSPDDRRRASAIIHRESRRLSHLVENILQFSRLRYAGGRDLLMEEVDFPEVLGEGVDAMRSVLREREMRLDVEAEENLRVRANRNALTRIVVNLLDNAAKYGPEGQTVRVRIEGDADSARLIVEDEGPGVPAADRTRIWQAYRRLERDVKARLPGTGIGLSVVAELAELHGGSARVEEATGGGARFVVEIPRLERRPTAGAA